VCVCVFFLLVYFFFHLSYGGCDVGFDYCV
jgi:hypothetical protein